MKDVPLFVRRITKSSNEIFKTLKVFYPRHYDLRSSISGSVPVCISGKDSVIFCIKQDTEDGYPKNRIIKWEESKKFEEIFCGDMSPELISSHGIFFVEGNRSLVSFVDFKEKSLRTIVAISNTLHTRAPRMEHIEQLKTCNFGLYIFGVSSKNQPVVSFIHHDEMYGEVPVNMNCLEIPQWADFSTITSGGEGLTLFSDDCTIYSIRHESGEIKNLYTLKHDFNIRLGKGHAWQPVTSTSFLVHSPCLGFLSDDLEGRMRPLYFEDCIQCYGGIVQLFRTADQQIKLSYESFDGKKVARNFYCFSSDKKSNMVPRDRTHFFLQKEDEWYVIDLQKL